MVCFCFVCCVAKGETQDDAGEIASIRAFSTNGVSSPTIPDQSLPEALAKAGVSEETWQAIVRDAGTAVEYHWNPYTCCGTYCFMCFTVDKDTKQRVCTYVERLNDGNTSATLPSSIVARSQMEWQRTMVQASQGGKGATNQMFHKILFFEKEGPTTVPPNVQMIDRKLPTVDR
mmetsp:Transcript_24574/g.41077  ORF Transcript_24574/g.41077 Transcript_24574/m.41077 type:complete len:174 (+) Transcript_24574:328-849(+)|eukprot:CAMPEP_0198216582 /NCGR_PEP_ID=MMETSP1445-20131203/58454_1 /TAXON_ID=36898 /ORGANISM="Pyramimonas sp., Strain CCMP2087" /LENGTH=173 /DNA_ID=CAMNT_0043892885 /DNA_START=263 /DNA_END=784 /DNA_ORIENTATION=-